MKPSRILIADDRGRTEGAANRRATRADAATGLIDSLSGPLPVGEVPLKLASAAFAAPGRREQVVVLPLLLPPTDASAPETFTIELVVYDAEGRRELLREGHVATVNASGKSGSVYTTVEVPDFRRDALAVSGVAVGVIGHKTAGGERVADLLPFAPTAVRAFPASARVGMLFRMHRTGVDGSVTVRSEILDDAAAVVYSDTKAVAVDPANGRGTDYRFEVPTALLRPGAYLARFEIIAGRDSVKREIRFQVLH